MKKSTLNFIINSSALVLLVFIISTGFLMYFTLPPGSGHLEIWGMNRHAWGDIHLWLSVFFVAMMFIHLFLHWNWILSMVMGKRGNQNKQSKRRLWTIAIIVLIIMIALSPYFSPVVDTKL